MKAKEPTQRTEHSGKTDHGDQGEPEAESRDHSVGIWLFISVALAVGFLRTLNPFVGLMAALIFVVAVFVLMNRKDDCS